MTVLLLSTSILPIAPAVHGCILYPVRILQTLQIIMLTLLHLLRYVWVFLVRTKCQCTVCGYQDRLESVTMDSCCLVTTSIKNPLSCIMGGGGGVSDQAEE